MKPLLLVEALAVANDSGLGRHVRLFVESLTGLLGDAEIRVVLPRGHGFAPPPGITAVRVPARPYRLVCETVWPALIAAMRPKVVFCLGQSLPLWRPKARYALLVPDAAPLEDLPFPASGHQNFNRRWMRRRLPRADRIITSAEFTRRRLETLLGIPGERVSLVPPVRGRAGDDGVSDGEGNPDPPFFLAVGNVEPRKNYPTLLRAYALLAARKPDAPPLHILGHAAWDNGETAALRVSLGLERRIFLHGHVAENRRKAFLQNCTAFVSSSRYEGFGLPLFEALRAGKACVYHGDSAQAEFAAGFALSADCGKPEALAEILELLWRDANLRKELERRAQRDFQARWDGYHPAEALRKALLPLLSDA